MAKLMTVITVRRQAQQRPLAAAARPHDPADYSRPALDGSGLAAEDIPLAGTKPGATLDVWPSRTLDGCRAGGRRRPRHARRVGSGRRSHEGPRRAHRAGGNRITITVGGLVHDMFSDGTLENGVDDIAGLDGDKFACGDVRGWSP